MRDCTAKCLTRGVYTCIKALVLVFRKNLGITIIQENEGSNRYAKDLAAVTSDTRFRSRIVRHWLKSLYIHFDGG